jgi:hypothetical protein
MNLLRFSRHGSGLNRRLQARRPIVEDLEGRQLLSGIVGNHIGSAMIQGTRIGSAMIQGAHVGSEMIQGGHIGTNVMNEVGVMRKH